MTTSGDIAISVETENRIRQHLAIAKCDDNRREICLTWSGYIAALLEWGLLDINEYSSLLELLEPIIKPDDPVLDIFLGFNKTNKE